MQHVVCVSFYSKRINGEGANEQGYLTGEIFKVTLGFEMKFKGSSDTYFWISLSKEFPISNKEALKVIILIAITYSSETGFSTLAAMTIKFRSRLDMELR